MFNFKKNNSNDPQPNPNNQANPQSITNTLPDPNPALTQPSSPLTPPTPAQVNSSSMDQPLVNPPNLDDFDPPTLPALDNTDLSSLDEEANNESTALPTNEQTNDVQDQNQEPVNPPQISNEPITNLAEDESLENEVSETNPLDLTKTENKTVQEAEKIMSDISTLQEEFNTKYDELAENIRLFLKKASTQNEVNEETNLDAKPNSDEISSDPEDDKFELKLPPELAQQELEQRANDNLSPEPEPEKEEISNVTDLTNELTQQSDTSSNQIQTPISNNQPDFPPADSVIDPVNLK